MNILNRFSTHRREGVRVSEARTLQCLFLSSFSVIISYRVRKKIWSMPNLTPPVCILHETNKPTPGAFLKKINLFSQ